MWSDKKIRAAALEVLEQTPNNVLDFYQLSEVLTSRHNEALRVRELISIDQVRTALAGSEDVTMSGEKVTLKRSRR